jgi:hypothetical protein
VSVGEVGLYQELLLVARTSAEARWEPPPSMRFTLADSRAMAVIEPPGSVCALAVVRFYHLGRAVEAARVSRGERPADGELPEFVASQCASGRGSGDA